MTVASRQELELWAAARVVTEHAAGAGCNRCDPDGCRLHAWADFRLRQWEQAHGQRYPHQAPSWQAAQHTGRVSR